MPRFNIRDLAVLLALTGGLTCLAGTAIQNQREAANRVGCASNLRQIGMALQLYANENRGGYPRTVYDPKAPPVFGTPYDDADIKPSPDCDPFAPKTAPEAVRATRPKPNDVTAALYLLARTQDLTVDVFTCPSTRLAPWDGGGPGQGVMNYTNFPGKAVLARHLSYGWHNPYPTVDAVAKGAHLNNSLWADFAIAADIGAGDEAALKLTPTSPEAEKRLGNSLNHGRQGQNVLYADGTVRFSPHPFASGRNDNIYVAGDAAGGAERGEPAFHASMTDANDVILLPTAADLGQTVTDIDAPPTPITDPAALVAQIKGTYDGMAGAGKPGTLEVTETSFRLAGGAGSLVLGQKPIERVGDVVVFELTPPNKPAGRIDVVVRPGQLFFVEGGKVDQWTRRSPAAPTSGPATAPSTRPGNGASTRATTRPGAGGNWFQ